MKEIKFILGKLCSGKSYYCEHHLQDHKYISVSKIVKQLAKTQSRSELQKTKWLDNEIANEIIDQITDPTDTITPINNKIVIDGVRQWSIIKEIVSHCKIQYRPLLLISFVWLQVEENILRDRYDMLKSSSQSSKYDISFEDAIDNDYSLGLNDIANNIFSPDRAFDICETVKVLVYKGEDQWETVSRG